MCHLLYRFHIPIKIESRNFTFIHSGSELSEKTVRSRISDAFEKVRGVNLAREDLQMFG